MNHPRFLLTLILTVVAGLVPGQALAQPLILAGAVNKTAFVGDGNVTFTVDATGSPAPTYQWQTGTSGNFSNITDSGIFSGSTTPTLTINVSDLSLNGTEYRCKVISNGVKVNSFAGTLTVYATPTMTPALTVTGTGVDGSSNPTIAANSTANITITLTGVNPGDTVRVQRILDANSDGNIQVSEAVVQNYLVTDGNVTKFGGVTDPDLPGDDDGAANGNITTHLTLPTSPEGGRLAGTYLIKVSSPSGEFEPITKTLTVTQPNYGQTFSGQVTSGGTPVPNTSIVLLSSNGDNQEFVAGMVTDANGNYTIAAPVGTYNVIGFAPGYVQSFSSAAQVTLASGQNQTGADLSLDAATCTITTKVVDANSAASLRGVQFFVQSNNNGQVAIIFSNADGNLIGSLTSASDWDFQTSQYSTHALGYLQPQNDPIVDTTGASSSNFTISEPNLQLTAGNALIYGTVEDSNSNPLAGVKMNDNDSNFQDYTTTDSSGNYYLLANGPASGTGDTWYASPDDSSPVLSGYVAPNGVNMNVLSGQAYPTNFVAQLVNAHFQGTVTNDGTPVVGVVIDAQPQNGGTNIQATTDGSGNFDLGVGGGNWNITLDSSSADSGNLVGPQLSETISNNQTITGIAYQVLSATAIISGNVKDSNGNSLSSNYNVSATTTISGVQYSADSNIDGSGNYSLPLVNGTWTISVQGSNGPPPNFQDQTITVTGNQTLNLGPLQPTAHFQGTVTNDGTGVAGVQIDAVLQNSNISFQTTTDSNGAFDLGVINGTWSISLDSNSTNQNNLVAPLLTETIADTQTISGISYEVLSATAFVSGTAKDGGGNPLATSYNVNASANISGVQYNAAANLDGSGDYSLPLVNGTWTITVNSINGPPANYQPLTLVVNGSQTLNLTPFVATAHFQGTVTNNGSPVSGMVVDATQQSGGNAFIQTTTDSNGNFDLGVVGGTWNINLDPNSVQTDNLLVTTLGNETITDTQTIPGLVFDVLTATGTISGTVSDYNGTPVPNNANVFASTTINSVIYNSSESTDGSGHYSLPVVDGDWTVQAGGPSLNFNTSDVTVSGSATLNLMASVITSQPTDQSVTSGQSASIGLVTNTPGSYTLQWQVSTDGGSTWSNLSDDSIYSSTANSPLQINATTALDGYEYECVVSFTYNSSPVSQTSTAATLTVTPADQPPGISVSPINQQITSGGNATFDVSASGYPAPDIQWQVSTDGGATWSNLTDGSGISGSSTSTLTLATPPLASSGFQYRAVASNSSGSPSTSGPATLLVGFSNNYLTWLNNSFGPSQLGNPAESGLTATPAGDGIPNLVKYALGLPSLRSDQDQLPHATSSGGVLSLSFSAAQADVTYTVQASTDLINWSTTGVNVQVNAGVETATYSLSNGQTVFLRIVVTPNTSG